MALGFYFAPQSMTSDQYDEVIKRLKTAKAHHPAGRTYHICFGAGDKMQVFDVWDSQESFEKFGATLVPIMQAVGLDPGQPMVATVHNVIVPSAKTSPAKAHPAARPKAKARKAAPKKKAGRAKK